MHEIGALLTSLSANVAAVSSDWMTWKIDQEETICWFYESLRNLMKHGHVLN